MVDGVASPTSSTHRAVPSLSFSAAPVEQADAAAPRRPRNANMDRLRLLALSEIVIYHATDKHVLAGVGLPIFLLFTVALNARPHRVETDRHYLLRKARAFLVPWAAWSVIYAASQTVAPLARGEYAFKWFEPGMLLLGTQRHLWYLIFALIASVTAHYVYRATARIGDSVVILAGAAIGCGVMIPGHMLNATDTWLGDWMVAIPAIPIGIALGRCVQTLDPGLRLRRTAMLVSLVVTGMIILHAADLGFGADRFAMAIIPAGLVIAWPGRPDPLTSWLTGLRLGVYLVHMFVIGLMHFSGHLEANLVLRSAVVIVGSIAAAWLLSRCRPTRWLVQSRSPSGGS